MRTAVNELQKTYNHPLSRVRARAHSQEFYCFCCHKHHRLLHKPLNISILQHYLEQLLTSQRCPPSKYAHRDSEKQTFYPTILLFFLHFLLPYSSLSALRCDTCDSKKSKSVQNARATRTHEKHSSHCSCFFHFSLGARRSKHTFTLNSDTSTSQYKPYIQKKLQFSAIYSLFGVLSPHILIEAHQ